MRIRNTAKNKVMFRSRTKIRSISPQFGSLQVETDKDDIFVRKQCTRIGITGGILSRMTFVCVLYKNIRNTFDFIYSFTYKNFRRSIMFMLNLIRLLTYVKQI